MDHHQERLSQREEEILRLAAQGLTDKQIAVAVGVQLSTIRTYWDRLKNKLGAVNRTQAVARALGTTVRANSPEFRLAECFPHMVVIGDGDGRILFANSRWNDFFGRQESILHADRFLRIHPDDGDAFTQMWRRVLAGGAVEHGSVRYRRRDGSYARHLTSVAPFDRDGDKVRSLIGVSVDLAHVDG